MAVAGGGAIGLSIAWRASLRGFDVTLVDPDPGRGAAWVAAGMLAPASEAHFGEEALVRLLAEGASRWPTFAEELEAASGLSVGYESTGTLLVAHDAGDRNELARSVAFQQSLGLRVTELTVAELRALEPGLSPTIRSGAKVHGDHQVNNRAFIEALRFAGMTCGVEFVSESIERIENGPTGPTMRTQSGAVIDADVVVVALGADIGRLPGFEKLGTRPVRPVKGHILRLQGSEPITGHTLRAIVKGRSVYLVPRQSGEIVVGATVEERGFDTTVQAGEVFRLLEDARAVLPGIDELELVEANCGLRPGSQDNAPTIALSDIDGVIVASGHYRNGILLAPLTADLVLSLATGITDPAQALLDATHQETP